MTKTELRNEFNKIKKENKFWLKGYTILFDYGYVSHEMNDCIGHCDSDTRKVCLNNNELNREDILDILIHEMAHACIYTYNTNKMYPVDNHGDEWYSFYKKLGGIGGEDYANYWKNNGMTITSANKLIQN